MTESKPLVYYDISSPLQPRTYASNPSKSRYALNFKGVRFETRWTEILDIPNVRKGLDCPATRKLDNGSDFYTLPMLHDPVSGKVLGDTFDIANYLDDTYPDAGAGRLFPPDSTRTGLDYESPAKDLDTLFHAPITTNAGAKNGDYARFNLHVDATFTANIAPFVEHIPFNPGTAEATKALFAKRAHLDSWDDLTFRSEVRQTLLEGFKVSTESLAELFSINKSGPYLEGEQPNYADLIVGGWLNMLSIVMPQEEWRDFRMWHDGVLARLHDALQANFYESKRTN